jgi:hypothetical protein
MVQARTSNFSTDAQRHVSWEVNPPMHQRGVVQALPSPNNS